MRKVSTILSNFEKQVGQLYAIQDQRTKSLMKRRETIMELKAKNVIDSEEASHAERVAKKIQAIIK